MKFYHGTTKKNWNAIIKEGVLWGRPNTFWGKYPDGDYRTNNEGIGHKMSRVTWLAKNKQDAGIYNGNGLTSKKCVILEIDFPEINWCNNWQITISEPIPINKIKRIL